MRKGNGRNERVVRSYPFARIGVRHDGRRRAVRPFVFTRALSRSRVSKRLVRSARLHERAFLKSGTPSVGSTAERLAVDRCAMRPPTRCVRSANARAARWVRPAPPRPEGPMERSGLPPARRRAAFGRPASGSMRRRRRSPVRARCAAARSRGAPEPLPSRYRIGMTSRHG